MTTRQAKAKLAWFTPAILSMAFGAGGATMVTRHDVARHEKCIEQLTERTQENEKTVARIDERLARIERDIHEIHLWFKAQ